MSTLPDHGEAFWAMFPHDEEGNVIINEIDLDKYESCKPDPEVVAEVEALNRALEAKQ